VQDGLGLHGCFVDGAIAEVGDLLGVVERPGGIGALGMVAGIGGGRGVVVGEREAQLVVADQAREAAVAGALELAVPVGDGHPDFKINIRVGRRLDGSGHAAEGRQVRHGFAVGHGEAAGRHGLRAGDGGGGEVQLIQGFACLGRVGCRCERHAGGHGERGEGGLGRKF
jgi:hypothetical protein